MSGEASSYYGAYQRPNADEAARYAAQHAGRSEEEDHGLFSSILSKFNDDDDDEQAPHRRPVNAEEVEHAAHAHDQIYNQREGAPSEEHSSRDLGSAAALQAFKMFSGGGGSSGGGSSNQLIGMAMGEAMKLFNNQSAGGGKANQAEMLQQAAMTAMQLYMTHQSSKQGGGGSGGGIGALMGMLGGGGGGGSSGGNMAASLLSKFL
ncbi:hypothetical protein EC973_002551 [Apophysomyces ossiformis]|uniref:DUF7721 domain-containing protein n=1 Tax=Apophysomyces ossiformis TaxID=679940 RepID=A0A8H7BXV1_9FUNG|nr:hypothetical protein EC973_002551 [Apophysomyces ossiformis]